MKPTAFDTRETTFSEGADFCAANFLAMGCPCEILMETSSLDMAKQITDFIRKEAWRIEAQWSRYLPDSIVERINSGEAVAVDIETGAMIDYAEKLWGMSEHGFDITSGVLRRIWTFDGGSKIPNIAGICEIMKLVGWDKVSWNPHTIQLRPGMQIDFGGIGKEYAVDQCIQKIREATDISCLINFGGDLAVSHRPKRPWRVGMEEGIGDNIIEMEFGAIATSGSTQRYIMHNNQRLAHILDARTGWPVDNAPACVTVRAETCTEAGMLATLAFLKGAEAVKFLSTSQCEYWINGRLGLRIAV